MKVLSVMLTIAVLAGCARTGDSDVAKTAGSTAPVPQGDVMATKAITASATGTVESVDVSARTVTIAHGPIAAVNWPAMTMTFDAPAVDLNSIKAGDHVNFELAVNGMHGEVVKIARQ
jgi:Cu(I)/Ag(I) efflux system periplasmic protein CusF